MSNNKALKGLKVPGLDDIYYVPDINQVVYMDVENNENVEDVAGLEAQIAQIKTQLADKVSNSQLESSLADKVNSAQLENSLANKVSVVEQNLTAEQQATVRENIGAVSSEDVSAAIANTAAKIGDTLTTMRIDLDDTWLLCNGDTVSIHDYEELAALYPNLLRDWNQQTLWTSDSGTTNAAGGIHCITYANGYWVAGGSYNMQEYDSEDGYSYGSAARIAYTQDPEGNWTIKDITSNPLYGYQDIYCTINSIIYANNLWVVVGVQNSSKPLVAYASEINGYWTRVDSDRIPIKENTNGSRGITSIAYGNGYWVIGGHHKENGANNYKWHARIAYATSLAGPWTSQDIWTYSYSSNVSCGNVIRHIMYVDDKWIVSGNHDAGYKSFVSIATTSALGGSWNTTDLWGGQKSSTTHSTGDMIFANNQLITTGSLNGVGQLAYSQDLSSWNTIEIPYFTKITHINFLEDQFIIGGYYTNNNIQYARLASLSNSFTLNCIKDIASGTKATIEGLSFLKDLYVVGYRTGDYAAHITVASDLIKLPAVSQEQYYVYIKIKED